MPPPVRQMTSQTAGLTLLWVPLGLNRRTWWQRCEELMLDEAMCTGES